MNRLYFPVPKKYHVSFMNRKEHESKRKSFTYIYIVKTPSVFFLKET